MKVATAGGGGGIGGLLRELHIPWPAADENKLREAADTWNGLAEAVKDAHALTTRATNSIVANNSGAAIDAFASYGRAYGAKNSGLLPLGAEACQTIVKACHLYVDAVAHTKHQIEEAGAEAGAT
jgi:hypothetical protein